MSKFTIVTTLVILSICLIAGSTYYYYVLDIEYHTFEVESEDEFVIRVTAPKEVKKNQRFSILAELQYIGQKEIVVEHNDPTVQIHVLDSNNEHIDAYSPIVYPYPIEEMKLRPNDTFSLNLEYKLSDAGEYTILVERRFFKVKNTEKKMGDFQLPVTLKAG